MTEYVYTFDDKTHGEISYRSSERDMDDARFTAIGLLPKVKYGHNDLKLVHIARVGYTKDVGKYQSYAGILFYRKGGLPKYVGKKFDAPVYFVRPDGRLGAKTTY